jgi:hypothetical protein
MIDIDDHIPRGSRSACRFSSTSLLHFLFPRFLYRFNPDLDESYLPRSLNSTFRCVYLPLLRVVHGVSFVTVHTITHYNSSILMRDSVIVGDYSGTRGMSVQVRLSPIVLGFLQYLLRSPPLRAPSRCPYLKAAILVLITIANPAFVRPVESLKQLPARSGWDRWAKNRYIPATLPPSSPLL